MKNSPMKLDKISLRNPLLVLALFILIALLSFLAEQAYQRNRIPDVEFEEFQNIFLEKEKALGILMSQAGHELDRYGAEEWIRNYGEKYENKLRGKGFTLLVYSADSLSYWSDNITPVPLVPDTVFFSDAFLHFSNSVQSGLYLSTGEHFIVGLMLIKNHYPYQNKFLKNTFQENFSIPHWVKVTRTNMIDPGAFPVKNLEGKTVFYLSSRDMPVQGDQEFSFPVFLYLLAFLSFLFLTGSWLRNIRSAGWYYSGVFVSAILLLFIKQVFHTFKIPVMVFGMELFSSRLYAGSAFWSSLGDLIIFSIISLYFIFLAYRGFSHFRIRLPQTRTVGVFILIALYMLGGSWFFLAQEIFQNLMIHSSISFELHRLLDLTPYSFLGLMAAGFLFFAGFFILDTAAILLKKEQDKGWKYLLPLAGTGLVYLIACVFSPCPDPVPWLFFLAGGILLIIFRHRKGMGLKYNLLVLFVFVFSLLMLYNITTIGHEKEKNIRKVFALNLSAEHDAVAELLLGELGPEIRTDPGLKEMMDKQVFTPEEVDDIFDHIRSGYFSGFWERYYLEITICHPYSVLEIIGQDTTDNCYHFFMETIESYGEALPDSNFWFLNEQNGRITYFGWFRFPVGTGAENSLFIRLDSKLTYGHLGYPELLLEGKFEQSSVFGKYSYAKYTENNLINQSGDFPYSLTMDVYGPGEEEFRFLRFDGYHHLIYTIGPGRQIMISVPVLKGMDLLIDASYLFVFFFLWLNIILLLINLHSLFAGIRLNFKMRIQLAMVGTLFLALILIGGGAVYYSIRQYSAKHHEIIREKIQSVYIELDHKLAFEPVLTSGWNSSQYSSLNDLLIKFSNVFYTDINLYDPGGILLATSRPEIFDKGLAGPMIHNRAYRELKWNRKAEYVQRESIGSMRYLSAYVPFTNSQGKLLAYLNLPYFTRQTVLSREISMLVVAIVNISFLLLILTISLAVFISNRITDPLRMIQKKFSRLKLGRSYEKIVYDSHDEIGELVNEYNRMVTELARSVDKLARTERETAWREMAKQVAHEIKNPLTPMMLIVQQLKRSLDDKDPGWEENFHRFTATLIEQIENLSSIATAFSHFAQMPKSNFQAVDMVEKLKNTLDLFANTGNVDFSIDTHGHQQAVVLADKEQMNRVFTNLFKNGIQAIPENRKGKIHAGLSVENDTVVISITDNGKGIPDELKDKLFMPNFTTKSSGMGLGLAIVRNIIVNTGGTIHFETQPGKGTTFFVELPLYREGLKTPVGETDAGD